MVLTAEQKLASIEKRKIQKKKWIEGNNKKYKELLKRWYIQNKTRLNERRTVENAAKKKLLKKANIESVPEKVDGLQANTKYCIRVQYCICAKKLKDQIIIYCIVQQENKDE